MFSNEQWLANSGADFYNGVATQSLRLDDGSSAYLTRTPSSAGNQKTWTFSSWIKRANANSGHSLISAGADSSNWFLLYFASSQFSVRSIGTHTFEKNSTPRYRDSSAWYHVIVAMDTTQATAEDRAKVYINNQRITGWDANTIPAQNSDTFINSTNPHNIGRLTTGSNYQDGYLAETILIDGLALTPTSFGEFKNGVWIPIDTSGLTFGTNGFRLKFDQVGVGTASTSTIGADTSGNTNHFTSSGIVASDCAMPDSPENNFATLNPLNNPDGTFSEGNLKWLSTTTDQRIALATMPVDSLGASDSYAEVRIGSKASSFWTIGVFGHPKTWNPRVLYRNDGVIYRDNTNTQTGKATFAEGDIMAMSYDVSSGTVTFYKNNSVVTTETVTDTDNVQYFGCTSDSSGGGAYYHWNFGADSSFQGLETAQDNTDANGIGDFYYAPPSGFLALCTANLPEPTIGANSLTQADDHFNTVLYTGTGSSNAITGVGFQPDWTWIKRRSGDPNAIGNGHNSLYDSTRGVTNEIYSDLTSGEADNNNSLTAFGTDGFTVGSEARVNANNETHVAWNWKANGGTTSSNSDGSITSTVQANTDAGFSIVTYTGTGSNCYSRSRTVFCSEYGYYKKQRSNR